MQQVQQNGAFWSCLQNQNTKISQDQGCGRFGGWSKFHQRTFSLFNTSVNVKLMANDNPVYFKIDNQTQKTDTAVITNEIRQFIAQEGKFCV